MIPYTSERMVPYTSKWMVPCTSERMIPYTSESIIPYTTQRVQSVPCQPPYPKRPPLLLSQDRLPSMVLTTSVQASWLRYPFRAVVGLALAGECGNTISWAVPRGTKGPSHSWHFMHNLNVIKITSSFCLWYRYKILHIPRQHSCRGMC